MKNVDRRQSLRGPHYPQRLPEVTIEIARGAAQRRQRVVRPPVFLIGAAADCDLVLGDPLFPTVHTYLYVTSTGVSARHIGEGPALLVNGQEVESTPLADGDLLQLGVYEFVLRIHGVPAGDGRGRPATAMAGIESEGSYDPDWEQLQMLLCDLPAPIRPAAAQGERRPAAAKEPLYIYERRRIA